MNSLQDQPVFEGLVKSCNMDHILLLVEKIGNQLLDPTDFHLLTHEKEIVMEVVEDAVVSHIDLEEVVFSLPLLSQLTNVPLSFLCSLPI